METFKMKKERKELVKKFKVVIEDLLDNYELYTEEEKTQIKEIFQKVADLNKVLDKYDLAKERYWMEFVAAYGQFFSPNGPMGL
jgi:predicted methyltransferase